MVRDSSDWEYHVDQDLLPAWYDAEREETRARSLVEQALKKPPTAAWRLWLAAFIAETERERCVLLRPLELLIHQRKFRELPDFSRFFLRWGNLSGTVLDWLNFSSASFADADLSKASLRNANLVKANFTRTPA